MNEFQTKLTSLDLPPASTRAEHDRAMRDLFERKLRPADVLRLALLGTAGLAGAVVCGSLALTEPAATPVRTRVVLGALALMGLGWPALAGVIFKRGALNSSVHGVAAATIGFAFTLMAVVAIGVASAASARPLPTGALLVPIAMLSLAAVVLVTTHVRQAELRLRRDALQVEYRLARMLEGNHARSDG